MRPSAPGDSGDFVWMLAALITFVALCASSGCAIGVPPLRTEAGLGVRSGAQTNVTGSVAVGAHLASAIRASPIDVGAGVIADQTAGPTEATSAWYGELSGRAHETKHTRTWFGARYQRGRQDMAPSTGVALRLEHEVVSPQVRSGGGSGGRDFFAGGGIVGLMGSGYFLEVGTRTRGAESERQTYVLVGVTLRVPGMLLAVFAR